MLKFLNRLTSGANRYGNIALVACDLDGTLLTEKNEIHPAVFEAAEALSDHGLSLVLASGRTDGFTRSYARMLGEDIPVISLNGALMKDAEGRTMHTSLLPERLHEVILGCGAEQLRHLSISLFSSDGIRSTESPPLLPRYLATTPKEHLKVPSLLPFYSSAVFMTVTGPYLAIQHLSVLLAKEFKDHLVRLVYQSRSRKGIYYLEVSASGVSKATALRELARTRGLKRSGIAAIGDYTNDIEMLTFATAAGVMKNGMDELKKQADYITVESNNAGGVAGFFRFLIEHRRNTS